MNRSNPGEAVARMLDGETLWCSDLPRPELPSRVGAVVATSGTTGSSKLVVLSRDALVAAARIAIERAGTLTWHLALPTRHVAGLMVALRSHLAGRAVPDAAADLSRLCPTGDGDAISLVPTQLHRALHDPGISARLAAMDLVLVGGSALDPTLRGRAEEAGITVVESYGMSETCGGVVWDARPLPGVDLAITDGRVSIGGPTLFDGYLGDPGATDLALVDGRLLTRDRGRLRDGLLHLEGRIDDVVISGGVNIDLTEVGAAVARTDPEAAVVAVDDPEWGSRVVLVSPRHDLPWWRTVLATQLPRTWLPRQHIAHPVPLTAVGKPDRAAMRALATADDPTTNPPRGTTMSPS